MSTWQPSVPSAPSVPSMPSVRAKRRAPFADNPSVGERGTRTQRRILRAALDVFGEVGYHECRVEAITEAAGCSRPSFYQYFSSKEDLFRQLAGHVARLLYAITEGLEPVTPDAAGRAALRAWLEDYSDIYDDYTAVFNAFAAARGSDDAIASGATRVARRQVGALTGKIDERHALVSIDQLTPIVFHMVVRTNRYRHLLGAVGGDAALDRERVNDALADIVHRSIFGAQGEVNITEPDASRSRPRVRGRGVGRDERMVKPSVQRTFGAAGMQMRARLLKAAREVFAERGYHDTRVNDIVELASASHGTFYRYFENKYDLFRVIAAQAGRRIADAIERVPDLAAGTDAARVDEALRQWMGEYAAIYREEGSIIRVWVEAMAPGNELAEFSIGALEGARRRLARFLGARGFGDVDVEALVLLALIDLEAWAAGPSRGPHPDAVAGHIARGFLGVNPPPIRTGSTPGS